VLARVGPPGPAVVVAAHLDTVFPDGTPLAPSRRGGRLLGPGIGDNSVAVAALVAIAGTLARSRKAPSTPVILAATVGEEGLGDLRGIRGVLDRAETVCVVALEGHGIDGVVHRGIASARLVVAATGPGGHSWRDRGTPSAVHALIAAGQAVLAAGAPAHVNIGMIAGGTSVNTIAPDARMEVDVRSTDDAEVDAAVVRIRAALASTSTTVALVGRRPGGGIPATHPLIEQVARARRAAGLGPAILDAASTDANAAYGRGIAAVTLGLTRGGGTHRVDEWIDIAPLEQGVAAATHLACALAGIPTPRRLP
jgi:acetylornithine deacetylase/succinyl-diaminopimelate desuccinylase-like protein